MTRRRGETEKRRAELPRQDQLMVLQAVARSDKQVRLRRHPADFTLAGHRVHYTTGGGDHRDAERYNSNPPSGVLVHRAIPCLITMMLTNRSRGANLCESRRKPAIQSKPTKFFLIYYQ